MLLKETEIFTINYKNQSLFFYQKFLNKQNFEYQYIYFLNYNYLNV